VNFTGNTLTAPSIVLSLTAEAGLAGAGGAGGPAVASVSQYSEGNGYYTVYGTPAGASGVAGTAATGAIAMTGNTITVSTALSLTLHVEAPSAGGPTLLPLDGAAGGNLVFSGNSLLGDGRSELDLQGSGSNADVDALNGLISIGGSPANTMTGFDTFVLANGDSYNDGPGDSRVFVAPDADTIELTPGHGNLVLFDTTATNTILDFQGYGAALGSVAQLQAEMTDQGGNEIISIPGDASVTLEASSWTPSALSTDLTDTTDSFSDQAMATSGPFAGGYLWSNAANWSGGVPGYGTPLAVTADGTDDLAALTMPLLTLDAAVDVVQAGLTAEIVDVAGAARLMAASGVTVTISGTINGSGGTLGADGGGAVLDNLATVDPGESYQVSNGGEVMLAASLSFQSALAYGAGGDAGTFALADPTNYFGASLSNVAPGDVLEVAGAAVTSFELDADNGYLSVQTNSGADYFFSHVTYGPGVAGFNAAPDPATGLLAVTFTAGDTFNDSHAIAGAYLWSDALNWSAGVPAAGASVYMFASGTDDVAGLTLASLGLTDSMTLDVAAKLTVDALSISANASIEIGAAATLDVAGPVIGADEGLLAADGAGSVLLDDAPGDPGETYEAGNGGTVVLAAVPSSQSTLEYGVGESPGTFVLPNPGVELTTSLEDIGPGDVLALPGTAVQDVMFDPNEDGMSVITDAGSYDIYPAIFTAPVADYTAVAEPGAGLMAITFAAGDTFDDNDAAAGGADAGNFLWSDGLNWAPAAPLAGADAYADAAGIDDIAGLRLNDFGLTENSSLEVAADLTVGRLSLGQFSTISVDGGFTFDVTGAFEGQAGGVLQAGGGGKVVLAGASEAGLALSYDAAGAPGTIALSDPGASIVAALENVGVGDVLELPGARVTSVTLGGSALTVQTDAGTYQFADVGYLPGVAGYTAAVDPATDLAAVTFSAIAAPCYCRGTRILTGRGDVAVEDLCVGDVVITHSGVARPVRWIGQRAIDCRRHARPEAVWPIRIARGAFGDGLPGRDLWLSPDHAVFTAGVLIPARYLVNGATIAQQPRRRVHYFHVELDSHDILLAEGLPAESFLDTGNRGAFSNDRGAVMAHADFARRVWQAEGCAELVTRGAALTAAKAGLLARAAALGHRRSFAADVHLLVDGVRVEPDIDGGVHYFMLPDGAGEVRLMSRRAVPAEVQASSRDCRRLGVAVSRLAVDGRLVTPGAGQGWYAAEPDWCWTDGAAAIDCAGARHLDVTALPLVAYWDAPAAAGVACAA
jgi:hypothetical protein